jgi:hypothetical protein
MATTSIVSLNQLINWFQQFQINHYMLKDFGFGETYDIGTSRQMDFPYMWVTMNDDNNIATGSNIRSAIPDISFSIMMMDKINMQENYLNTNGFPSDNSQEILSDMLQIIQDLIVYIQQDWGQYGVLISQDTSFFPVIDDTPDKATGIIARIVLRTRQVNCIIPEYPAGAVTSVYSQVVNFSATPMNSIQYLCNGSMVEACYGTNQTNLTDLVSMFNSNPPVQNNACFLNYGTYYDNGDGRVRCDMTTLVYNTLCPNGTLTLNVIYD